MSTWHVEFRDGRNGDYEARSLSTDSTWLYLYAPEGDLVAAFPKDIVLSAERVAPLADALPALAEAFRESDGMAGSFSAHDHGPSA